MKIGNISQTVLKRSVLKQLHSKREEAVIQPSVEEMCAGIQVGDENITLISSAVIYGDEKELGCYGIAKVVNDLMSRNGVPVGVDVVIQLPPYAYESRLKAMVGHMEAYCEEYQLQILGVKVSVNPVIRSSVISLTGVGLGQVGKILETKSAKPNMDIVLIGGVGTEGALRILNMREEELGKRFIPNFFSGLKKCNQELVVMDGLKMAIEAKAVALHQLSDGGILAGLWELGEAANLGLEVDLKKMTIRQDVIEVCEFVGVNPYQLSSIGSVLVVLEEGEAFVEKLQKEQIVSSVIGRTTDKNERVILNGGEKRFLDRPTPGELTKLFIEEQGESND